MSERPSPYAPPESDTRSPEGSAPRGADAALPEASTPIAVLLSLLWPGVGHAYARRSLRGAAWIGLVVLSSLLIAALLRAGARSIAVIYSIVLFAGLGVRLLAAIDVATVLRRRRGPRAPIVQTIVAWCLVCAVLIANALGTRFFVFEAFKIPSGSMIPTLLVGDHVFIDKMQPAARGDVIVFPFPEKPEQEFIKRIVGLPGDRLAFHDGHPILNGVALPSCLLGAGSYDDPGGEVQKHEGKVYLERLGDRSYLAIYEESSGMPSDQGPYVVKSGEVFVLGDNRNNSHDSRMWFGGEGGGVPIATVKGVPFAVWLSMDDRGFDWTRFGLALDGPHLPRGMASLAPALERCVAQLAH